MRRRVSVTWAYGGGNAGLNLQQEAETLGPAMAGFLDTWARIYLFPLVLALLLPSYSCQGLLKAKRESQLLDRSHLLAEQQGVLGRAMLLLDKSLPGADQVCLSVSRTYAHLAPLASSGPLAPSLRRKGTA